jgi:NAD(P)-dependent dehydrogenase (short-subunit alcohol dehydrogenase family)
VFKKLTRYSGCFNTEMMTKPFNSPAGPFYVDKDNINCILQRELPEAWEIAASVAFLLGDESAHVTKSTWSVDGGWFEAPLSRA